MKVNGLKEGIAVYPELLGVGGNSSEVTVTVT